MKMTGQPPKQYGLIIKGKKSGVAPGPSKLSFAFRDDSDSDNDTTMDARKSRPSATQTRVKKQAAALHEAALAEDPSVFDYDAAYEQMQEQKQQEDKKKAEADKDKKPKYIDKLLKSARRRELEYQAREERKQQKERALEGEQFADKETFITGAYRKQMEEVQKMREDQAYHDMLDERQKVTNQKDLSGFYRHFLNDMARPGFSAPTSGAEASAIKMESEEANTSVKMEQSDDDHGNKKTSEAITKLDKGIVVKTEPTETAVDKKTSNDSKPKPKMPTKQYRQRQRTNSDDEDEQISCDDDARKSSGRTKDKKHSIYSSGSESDDGSPPAARVGDGGLQVMARQARRSFETKMEEQRRRFFTPSPENSDDDANKDPKDNKKSRDSTKAKKSPSRRQSEEKSKSSESKWSLSSDRKDHHHRQSLRQNERTNKKPRSDVDSKEDVKPVVDPMVQRMNKLNEIFARHNTDDQIEQYRKRYFQRKADGVLVPPV